MVNKSESDQLSLLVCVYIYIYIYFKDYWLEEIILLRQYMKKWQYQTVNQLKIEWNIIDCK